MTRPALAVPPSRRLTAVDDTTTTATPATPRDTSADQPSRTVDGRGRSRQDLASMLALAVPLLLVNAAAVYGQAGWAHQHLVRSWTVAALFAAALESIGVYLAAEAHAALMAGDASLRLRLASYGVGLLVGTLNYAHFASGWQPTALAVTFGALSSVSPWLWAIRSRSLNRDRLRALGLVDPRAVRFSPLRWLLHFGRTWRAFRAAVWAGVVEPAAAIALSEPPDDADGGDDLQRVALIEAVRLHATGRQITRDALAAAIRGRGLSIRNEAAGRLAKELAAELDGAA